MKKKLAIVLSLSMVLCFGLASCGGGDGADKGTVYAVEAGSAG